MGFTVVTRAEVPCSAAWESDHSLAAHCTANGSGWEVCVAACCSNSSNNEQEEQEQEQQQQQYLFVCGLFDAAVTISG
jgi:hypothetical protein